MQQRERRMKHTLKARITPMNTSMKKVLALLSATLFMAQIAGATAVTYTNSYSASGMLLSSSQNNVSENGTTITGNQTITYDALGRYFQIKATDAGVPVTTTYNYNALGEASFIDQVKTVSIDGVSKTETIRTSLFDHGAIEIVSKSINGGTFMFQAKSITSSTGIKTTINIGDNGMMTKRTVTNAWGGTVSTETYIADGQTQSSTAVPAEFALAQYGAGYHN